MRLGNPEFDPVGNDFLRFLREQSSVQKRYAADAHNVPLQPFEITSITMAKTPQRINKRESERQREKTEKKMRENN
jgi:hypothetical protein